MSDNSEGKGGSSGDELEALLAAEFEDQLESAPAADQDSELEPAKRRKLESRGGACPPHPGFIGGVCIRCGAFKDETDQAPDSPGVALKYIHQGLEVSRKEAERLRAFSSTHAAASRRLLLVLDLDHTLLNSTRLHDVPVQLAEPLQQALESQPADTKPLLYHIPYMRMWTKLRPGIFEFLTAAKSLFELHIYTMGDSDYAAGMAAILDPDGQLFAGRVASSRDAGGAGVKDVDVLLGAEDVVLILDDTAAVWPRHQANLLQVERYVYFPACADRFGHNGTSYLERGTDEDAENGMLATCLRVLTEVHGRFFDDFDKIQAGDGDGPAPDARRILASIRCEIFKGIKILFSRIIPLDYKHPVSSHPLWKLAVDLGAECSTVQGPDITHVVAGDVTDKAIWGKSNGLHVVNANWVLSSAYKWKKADEKEYPVNPGGGGGKNGSSNNPVVVPQIGVDDEEDLKAALAAAGGGQG